jgi:acyl-CoA synthetase (AMP-forming)/AMP-acid ligase II
MSGRYFWDELEQYGDATVLEEHGRSVSYAELAVACDAFAARLPSTPQLVALEAGNDVEAIAAYLACLRNGHPVILMNAGSIDDVRIISIYQPDWLYACDEGQWRLKKLELQRSNIGSAGFGGELAVLLSTSGTTGAPKLVRLSRENIDSNARSIVQYLSLRPDECAITTLNFFYSYGMAVLNSHLAAGARVVLTDTSVTTTAFWDLFKSSGVTSLALVPYHFDLLDRSGFSTMDLPTLRYITQAGGRLHADRLERFARLSLERGWNLFVMYGQTEASPRMSYMPPADLMENLASIGRPIPGGAFELVTDDGSVISNDGRVGELVYRGPNVMLGYADNRADLARDRDASELRTGDMAERQSNGYFRVVGRQKRFIKLYGLRINLDDLENRLNQSGFPVWCSGTDELLAIFHVNELSQNRLIETIVDSWGIQRPNVAIQRLAEVPLLPSGKVDYAAMMGLLPALENKAQTVHEAFAQAFGRDVRNDDTFITLEGDSLLYLHLSLSLENVLGHVPRDWEQTSVGALESLTRTRSRMSSIPMEFIARCIAIVGVLTNHLGTLGEWEIAGGALSLLFLSGVSFARIHSHRLAKAEILNFLRSSLLRVVILYYVIITAFFIALPQQFAGQELNWYLFYANFSYDTLETDYLLVFWFICAYVQLTLFIALLWSIPPARRFFAKNPARFGYVMLAAGLCTGIWALYNVPNAVFTTSTPVIAYILALGWCAYFSKTIADKAFLSLILLATLATIWQDGSFQFKIFLAVIILSSIWVKDVTLPRLLGSLTVAVASASFYIYLLHILPVRLFEYLGWQESLSRPVYWLLGAGASIGLGILVARFVPRIEKGLKTSLLALRLKSMVAERFKKPFVD